MLTYNSDLGSVIDQFILDYLSDSQVDKLCLEIANMIRYNNVQRVFVEGKDYKGSEIGQYSVKYKKFRIKNNKQVNFIDLEFSGKLKETYKVKKTGKNTYAVGLSTEYGQDFARNGIKYVEYFGVSDSDAQKVNEIIEKYLNKDA